VPDAQKIICVGLNYADHIAEMKRATPEKPVIFTRFADSLVGHGEALVAPRNSTSFDYEGEFAVVIGREARHVDESDALDHVLGYTIMNDGSLRDYQRHTSQFTPGKNFPRSGSLGPAIVTADEFGAVGSQRIQTRVNGQLVQDSTLDQLVFDVAQLVAYCSEWTALQPGDIIATGTPGGVGDGRDPALWLSPGDVVEIAIDGLGALTTSVIEEV
jgi:2-keto-4-pentenoate hydratase/2-oxohepta-3-ene-1,7-dioic acid hydratase in catechol pathway